MHCLLFVGPTKMKNQIKHHCEVADMNSIRQHSRCGRPKKTLGLARHMQLTPRNATWQAGVSG